MKRSNLATIEYRLVIALFWVIALGAAGASAMTYHDNEVKMPLSASGYNIQAANYKITEYSVTSGQDPDHYIYVGLEKTYAGNNGSMTFKVGRQGSTDVANWFKSRIPSNRNTFNHDPGDLNFAFLGTLKLQLSGGVLGGNHDTYTLNDIAIAQGHSGLSNNWWFGGRNCLYTDSNTVKCTGQSTSGYPVEFHFRRGGTGNAVNEINLVNIVYKPYQTFSLAPDYAGESTECTWQLSHTPNCPPYIIYYNGTQSDSLRLSVRNNKIYNARNVPFDTTYADQSHSGAAAIFVMSSDGAIYASNVNVLYLFHHSTILGGRSVASAGELVAKGGTIVRMTNCSGHYRPTNAAYLQLKESLTRQGYTQPFQFSSCSPTDLRY